MRTIERNRPIKHEVTFCVRGVIKPLRAALGTRAHLLSRLRVNAALYAPPTPTPTPGTPGRPRKYGARVGNAAQLAATLRAEASAYTLNLYGGVREVMAVDRLVILKTLRCQVRVVWVFRKTQWIALVTTDLTLTVAQIIEYYGARWKMALFRLVWARCQTPWSHAAGVAHALRLKGDAGRWVSLPATR